MDSRFAKEIQELLTGPEYAFGDWPNELVPHVAAGLYSIWHESEFIYIGMSGRGLSEVDLESMRTTGLRRKAIYSRLESHASGRRSGDQFCLYICDHYVVPSLTESELAEIRKGTLSLDRKTKEFIRSQLTYRFVQVPSGGVALQLEGYIKGKGLDGKRPRLNPS